MMDMRKMRRADREITDSAEIEGILKKTSVIHLGMVDDGEPYVVPMDFAYKMEDGKLTLYMHGAREGKKIDILKKNPKVWATISVYNGLMDGNGRPCNFGTYFASVMVKGEAEILADPAEKAKALMLLLKERAGQDFDISEKMTGAVNVIKIEAEAYTANPSYRWTIIIMT